MKKQAESILWEIAKGDAIPQGEKTIYPSVRERISALTTLGKWEGWDKPAQKAAEIIAQDLQHTHEVLEDGDNPFEEVLDEEEDADDTDT
ncbi:MAG: heat-shock protein Hsp70, partial [Capnocytophaga sp.]|nr:heat-shock protein Hsp70 [Capnocytophaga sp.]